MISPFSDRIIQEPVFSYLMITGTFGFTTIIQTIKIKTKYCKESFRHFDYFTVTSKKKRV